MSDAKQVGEIVGDVIASIPEANADREAAWREAERKQKEDQFNRRVTDNWNDFARRVGARYLECVFDNFTATTNEQQQVLRSLRSYVANLRANVKSGHGILLFGPKGTGKDHLIVSASKYVLAGGGVVAWRNGVDLFGDIRDAIATEGSERDFVASLVRPDVFYLSDPLPPSGKLTEFQSAMLFRILDGRYRALRPTWVTVNATGRQDLEDRLGAQNADRIRDGSLTLFCGWPSYRKPAEVER